MDGCQSCFRIAIYLLISQWTQLPTVISEKSHSRQKRILWITSDGRLALPPGTTLVINPSLSLPFVRYPPDGFLSNMTISLPFTIDFNKLGLTDNENPFGVLPPTISRSMGRTAGNLLADYLARYLTHRRSARAAPMDPPPVEVQNALHGGERVLLYTIIEDFLSNFGLDGKACLLRAICEVHAHPMKNFGLIGEMMKLFFSASKSPFAGILEEYVKAETAGKGTETGGLGECWPYIKDCPKSLFSKHNPYVENNDEILNEVHDDERTAEVVYKNINVM